MKIALDAMGGDFGPRHTVLGAVMALREYQHIKKLFLVGDTPQIEAELKKHKCNDRRIDIVRSRWFVDRAEHIDHGDLLRRSGQDEAVGLRGMEQEAGGGEVLEDVFERPERGIERAREVPRAARVPPRVDSAA